MRHSFDINDIIKQLFHAFCQQILAIDDISQAGIQAFKVILIEENSLIFCDAAVLSVECHVDCIGELEVELAVFTTILHLAQIVEILVIFSENGHKDRG
jgi:hypothetical protein